MKITPTSIRLVVLPLFALVATSPVRAQDGVQFFEQKIRPVLVQHCYGCHSAAAREAKKLQGSLYLDSPTGIATGGATGPIVVKGKAADSLLIRALVYDELEMPPSGRLPGDVIADFVKWVELGTPMPQGIGTDQVKPKREINIDDGKQWWAFQPLKSRSSRRDSNSVDDFIRRAQQAHGLKPNHPTTREKLIRRAYFDLVGLPPAPEQIAGFLGDASPDAFARVVDELLARPAYGERWARHWLDAARFAESGGYEFDGFRPGAFHYRDWVIRALNNSIPYDAFIRMQLAGDILAPDDVDGAAATGFLVAGPYPGQITAKTVERIRYDQIDDMMMTIGGSMLGLTLGCVRCHEHKYDPIPQQDYYALAASLARTVHGSRTIDVDPVATERALERHAQEHAPIVAALERFATAQLPDRFSSWKSKELNSQPERPHWQSLEPITLEAERSYLKEAPGGRIVHDGLLNPGVQLRQRGRARRVIGEERYMLTFQTHQKNVQSLRIDAFTDKALPQRGPGLNGDGSFQLVEIKATARPLDRQSKDAAQTLKLKPVFAAFEDKDQPLSNAVDGKPETAWVVRTTAKKDNAAILEFDPPIAGFANGTELEMEFKFRDLGIGRLKVSISVEPNPATWAGNVGTQHVSELRALAAAFPKEIPNGLRVSLARWFAPFDPEADRLVRALRDHTSATPRPNLTEVYTTVAGGQDVFFLRRGEVDNKQGKAEPGFVQVLSHGDLLTNSFATQRVDPRVSLANWVTDVEHGAGALLARVIANRLWQHHFGKGIVGTPNDLGAQGERPSHPELLEYLAEELVQGGWNLKPLHRLIMLSDTYQLSHEIDSDNLKLDPANRLLWHYSPRRLEAEAIRDALLSAGGNLDPTMYGPSVLENSSRRSVYLRVKRSELLPIMTMFDAPEPTQSIGERTVTTVPTQALAMMNSPVVRQQAERLFARIQSLSKDSISAAVERAYQIAFGRKPSDSEMARMCEFISRQKLEIETATPEGAKVSLDKPLERALEKALVDFCHALFCLNEFIYID